MESQQIIFHAWIISSSLIGYWRKERSNKMELEKCVKIASRSHLNIAKYANFHDK